MLNNANDIIKLEAEALDAVASSNTYEEVETLRINFLGKQGILAEKFKALGKMKAEDRNIFGTVLNKAKSSISSAIDSKFANFKEIAKKAKLQDERVDITLPVSQLPINKGRIHPLTKVIEEVISIFLHYGFTVASGNDIETDYYNFEALNFPANHPARQMHDTFFMQSYDEYGKAKLLRTHTSPVQIHAMRCTEPPMRVIIPGKTYRIDEDATHSPMFHQLEGLLIDEKANIAQLKWILEMFCKTFFNSSALKIRFRPSFFPFTQPSMEVDVNCCYINDELQIGQGDKWLEILGCGMVHPNVLKAGYIDETKYQGFAWGVGIERLAMLKYGIKDLRSFFSSNVSWLKHYGFKSFASLELLSKNYL